MKFLAAALRCIFVVVGLLFADLQRAQACVPPPNSQPPTLEERYENSAIVFRGTVVETNANSWITWRYSLPMIDMRGLLGGHRGRFFGNENDISEGYYAYIAIDAFYKGGGIAEVAVEGFGTTTCHNRVYLGDDLIFFTSGDMPFLDAQYTGYPFSAIVDPSPDVLAELETLTGKPPTPPDATRLHLWLPLVGAAFTLSLLGARGAAALSLWQH